ncbi:hypothetical protein [Streptomyces mirabilis]|uniref:hypothetical protein n=1 Tax=Streptomyces mirabilis TaxID=68239 RepID=UPI003697746A
MSSVVIESTSCSAFEAKAEGRQAPKPSAEAEEPGGKVVDLMAALQESVRKAQAARGEGASDAEVHEMPTAKKKKTAAKTAGKALLRLLGPRRRRTSPPARPRVALDLASRRSARSVSL